MGQPVTAGSSSGPTDFQPHVLREYALLADGYRGALVGPRGDVPWLCVPRWDSPAVFSELIGGAGLYAVTPTTRYVWGGSYEPGSLIWGARWVTTDGVIESREALAFPGDPETATLLRRIVAVEGDAEVDVTLRLSPDFGRGEQAEIRRLDDGTWVVSCDDLQARWSGAAEATVDATGSLRLRLRLPAGGQHDLVLQVGASVPEHRPDPDGLWQQTERAWAAAVPDFANTVAPRDAVHAYAVLRGLTMPGGGMVAAATLGLPERAESGRNYDYRYVWLRDQAYAGLACGVDRAYPLLDEAVAFTTARVLEYGDELAPAYTVTGKPLADQNTLDLPGYPGGRDVVGNWVNQQFQLDSCGELLQLYATAARFDHLDSEDLRAAEVLLGLIEDRWTAPEAGVWELDDAWWTHSRLACVAGLRSAAEHLPTLGTQRLTTLAESVLDETTRRSLGPDQVWRQRPDRAGTDAALVLPPVRGALRPTDPRSIATLEAVENTLVEDGYAYRYRPDERPLGQAEGAFLMCGFAVSLANLAAGRRVEAFRWFERQRAACGPPGLLAEEFDVRQRQLRGNLPQAFVHALLLECDQRLAH